MTGDKGFAPNPFGCSLTLATCKPGIRNAARVGDWVAGFTSKSLAGHDVGSERLVYLMRVAEKLLLRDYFRDPRFRDKIPDMGADGPEAKAGDNIYRPLRSDAASAADFEQLANANHVPGNRKRDVGGNFVLVSDVFYYSAEARPQCHAMFGPTCRGGSPDTARGLARQRSSAFCGTSATTTGSAAMGSRTTGRVPAGPPVRSAPDPQPQGVRLGQRRLSESDHAGRQHALPADTGQSLRYSICGTRVARCERRAACCRSHR